MPPIAIDPNKIENITLSRARTPAFRPKVKIKFNDMLGVVCGCNVMCVCASVCMYDFVNDDVPSSTAVVVKCCDRTECSSGYERARDLCVCVCVFVFACVIATFEMNVVCSATPRSSLIKLIIHI